MSILTPLTQILKINQNLTLNEFSPWWKRHHNHFLDFFGNDDPR